MEHFLLTRFNLRLSESDPPHDEGWLRSRAELFGQFTAPSVRAQGHVSFRWLIFCDLESPTWLIDLLGSTATAGEVVRLPAFSSTLIAQEVATRLTAGTRLITTRLDNDDAIGRDFMATVYREAAACGGNTAINVLNGCQLNGETLCLRSDPSNAFISFVEDLSDPHIRTVFELQHQQWIEAGSVRQVVTQPLWMQVIHGGNLKNRLSGIPTKPSRIQPQFPVPLPGNPSNVVLGRRRLVSVVGLGARIVRSPHRLLWFVRVAAARTLGGRRSR